METDREMHCALVGVARRLDEALALLDAADLGDQAAAADIELALQRVKSLLRGTSAPRNVPLRPLLRRTNAKTRRR